MLRLGEQAPDFEAETSEGRLSLFDWVGASWLVLFAYPKAGTSICTLEMREAGRLQPDFAAQEAKLAAVSLDSAESQRSWADGCGAAGVLHIADGDRQVAGKYDLIQPQFPDMASRVLYIIDPARIVRLAAAYPPRVERSFAHVHDALKAMRAADAAAAQAG